jgi:hypothetical protein
MFLGSLANLGLSTDVLTGNRYALAAGNPLSFLEWDGHMLLADGGGGSPPDPNPGDETEGRSVLSTLWGGITGAAGAVAGTVKDVGVGAFHEAVGLVVSTAHAAQTGLSCLTLNVMACGRGMVEQAKGLMKSLVTPPSSTSLALMLFIAATVVSVSDVSAWTSPLSLLQSVSWRRKPERSRLERLKPAPR